VLGLLPLRHVRESLPDDVARTVACSIVMSRPDCYNSLFYDMSTTNLHKLQSVQNTLARTILGQRRCDHVPSSLAQLHWLPIKYRATFKLATLAHKILHCQQPDYLYQRIDAYTPARDLRSSNRGYLNPTREQYSVRVVSVSDIHPLPFGTVYHNTFVTLQPYLLFVAN
jgi:hypothetical protein